MKSPRSCGSRVAMVLLLSVLLTATGASSAGVTPPRWCEPSETLRTQLEAIEPWGTDCIPGQPCWREQLETAEKLLAAFPDDLFVNRTYQDLARIASPEDPGAFERLREEYRARARKHPDDPVAQYLAGRIAENADEERTFYEKALAAAPDFPWAHRGLGVVEGRKRERASRDQQLMRREFERFMTLCPMQLDAALQLAGMLEDVAFFRKDLPGLRAALRTARPRDQVRAWPRLWSLEFRIAAVAEHPQLRAQVARDLREIEDLRLTDDPRWWRARSQGLELTGDVEGRKRLEAELEEKRPCGRQAVDATIERWMADHQWPGDGASEEQRSAYVKAYYDATTEWLARCPEEIEFWLVRLGAIAQRKDLPNDAVKADLNRALEVWERYKGVVIMAESPYVQAARLFLDRGLEIERTPSLVAKEIERRRTARDVSKKVLAGKDLQQMIVTDSIQLARLRVLAGRAQLALGHTGVARTHLDAAGGELDAVRTHAGETARSAAILRDAEAELWEQRGALAEAEGHVLDASAMLMKASALAPTRKELDENARALWLRAGGTAEGWATFKATAQTTSPGVTVASEQSRWEKVSTILKPFNLQALDGRRWTLRDLDGKVAFINVWATWCGPCREELRHVQELYERVKGRTGLVLLTLNVDRDIGLVAPFMANAKYTFPVLLAEPYIADLWSDSLSIPRNWILDRSGVVRYERAGFDPRTGDNWVDGVVRLMDELTRKTATPAPVPAAGKPGASTEP